MGRFNILIFACIWFSALPESFAAFFRAKTVRSKIFSPEFDQFDSPLFFLSFFSKKNKRVDSHSCHKNQNSKTINGQFPKQRQRQQQIPRSKDNNRQWSPRPSIYWKKESFSLKTDAKDPLFLPWKSGLMKKKMYVDWLIIVRPPEENGPITRIYDCRMILWLDGITRYRRPWSAFARRRPVVRSVRSIPTTKISLRRPWQIILLLSSYLTPPHASSLLAFFFNHYFLTS